MYTREQTKLHVAIRDLYKFAETGATQTMETNQVVGLKLNTLQHFQMQLIKYPVQNNVIC